LRPVFTPIPLYMGKDELKSLSKNDLVRLVLRMQERLVALEKQVARGRKDSSTSSKPPSSDIVKPPKPKMGGGKKRKIGGQPGHERHERKLLPPEELDSEYECVLACCCTCHGALRHASCPPRVVQHVELAARAFKVTEYQAPWFWCPRCRTHQSEEFPEMVEKSGLFGPRMRAFVAYLKGACHMSYKTIQSLLRDVLGIPVSTGYLTKVVNKASEALARSYAELRNALPGEPWLNVDETGHKDGGKKHWTWCFRAPAYTVFKIDPSRGSWVLEDVLGEAFGGVLGSDLYSAYVKFAKEHNLLAQLCLAHLIRDLRYLTTLPDKVTKNYGMRVLDAIKKLFRVIHRREKMRPLAFRRALEKAKAVILKKALAAPTRREAQTMAVRFKTHGESYFTFITSPGVQPTNNSAEQAIRHVVIDRRITQGTRSEVGERYNERMWSAIATCNKQGRSFFEYLHASITAKLAAMPAPSLLFEQSP
jgi:transposase